MGTDQDEPRSVGVCDSGVRRSERTAQEEKKPYKIVATWGAKNATNS